MAQASVVSLLVGLEEAISTPSPQTTRQGAKDLPSGRRKKKEKARLPITSFGALLEFSKHSSNKEATSEITSSSVKGKLEDFLLILRRNRFFDRANAFSLLQETLLRDGDLDLKMSVLSLLLQLSGEGPWTELGSRSHRLLEKASGAKTSGGGPSLVFPSENVVYHSDSQYLGPHTGDLRQFHYRFEEFESPLDGLKSSTNLLENQDLICCEPEGARHITSAHSQSSSVFGALSHHPGPNNQGLDIGHLSLPELPFVSDEHASMAEHMVHGEIYDENVSDTPRRSTMIASKKINPFSFGRDEPKQNGDKTDRLNDGFLSDFSNLMGIGKPQQTTVNQMAYIPEQQAKFSEQWEQTKQSWRKYEKGTQFSGDENCEKRDVDAVVDRQDIGENCVNPRKKQNTWDDFPLDKHFQSSCDVVFSDSYSRHFDQICEPFVPVVSQTDLSHCVLGVLQGISSKYFKFEESRFRFTAVKCRLKSSTSGSLHNTLQKFSEIGTQFRRIEALAEYLTCDLQKSGLIAQPFGEAVKDYLNFFSASIISLPACVADRREKKKKSNFIFKSEFSSILPEIGEIPRNIADLSKSAGGAPAATASPNFPSPTILEILFHSRKLSAQLSWLYSLCQTTSRGSFAEFPTGTSLLTYLYEFESRSDSNTVPILRYMFSKTFEVYLSQLNTWAYEGTVNADWSEIFESPPGFETETQIYDNFCLPRKDFLDLSNIKLKTPSFLSQLRVDVALCGQSLHLLNSCNTQYYASCIFGGAVHSPCRLYFSPSNLQQVEAGYKALAEYQTAALQVVKQKRTLSKAKQSLEREEEKGVAFSDECVERLVAGLSRKQKIEAEKRRKFREIVEDLKKHQESEYLTDENQKAEELLKDRRRKANLFSAQQTNGTERHRGDEDWRYEHAVYIKSDTEDEYENKYKSDEDLSFVDDSFVEEPFEFMSDGFESDGIFNLPVLEPKDLPSLEHQSKFKTDNQSESQKSAEEEEKAAAEEMRIAFENSGFCVGKIPDLPELPALGGFNQQDNEFHVNPRVFSESQQQLASFAVAVNKCILSSLISQCQMVNRAALNMFEWEYDLHGHFAAFRRYFLMDAGDLANTFCHSLCESIGTTRNLLNEVHLNAQFQAAAQQTGHDSDPFFAPISITYKKQISRIAVPEGIDYFSGMRLRYKLDWPLTIIFTERAMAKYNVIFGFMFKVKRISCELHRLWRLMKRASSHRSHSSWRGDFVSRRSLNRFRILQTFRHKVQHLVDNLQAYYISQVLVVLWNRFNDELAKAQSIHDVIQSHRRYLKDCVHVCFQDEKLTHALKKVNTILSAVLQFKGHVERLDFSSELPDHKFANLQQIMDAIHAATLSLYDILHREVTEDVASKATTQFKLRLDFNGYYRDCRENRRFGRMARS